MPYATAPSRVPCSAGRTCACAPGGAAGGGPVAHRQIAPFAGASAPASQMPGLPNFPRLKAHLPAPAQRPCWAHCAPAAQECLAPAGRGGCGAGSGRRSHRLGPPGIWSSWREGSGGGGGGRGHEELGGWLRRQTLSWGACMQHQLHCHVPKCTAICPLASRVSASSRPKRPAAKQWP